MRRFARDSALEPYFGQQPIGGGGDGRELRMVPADAAHAMATQLELHARLQLGDQDVWVDRTGRRLQPIRLIADRHPAEVLRVDVRMAVQVARLRAFLGRVLVVAALDLQCNTTAAKLLLL